MTTTGKARTAAATAARTRIKHERWMRELSAAGWTVLQASHLAVQADWFRVDCAKCGGQAVEYGAYEMSDGSPVPLPRVLHAVSGHTCEEPK